MKSQLNWKKNLICITISQFLAMAGFSLCMPFIPMLLRDNLGIANDNIRGIFVSAYQFSGMLSFCFATAFWGVMADKFGRKIMLLRASYCAGTFFPFFALASNVWILLGLRFLTSFFSGTVNAAQTLIATTTPPEHKGVALGTVGTALWSGHMLGFLIGGVVVHYFNYFTAFLTCGIMYFVSGIIVHIFVEEDFTPLSKPVNKKSTTVVEIRKLLTPSVCWLLVMFLFYGISRRIEEPFIAMMVEIVHPEAAELFTGFVCAAAALGGVFSGTISGYLCDLFSPWLVALPALLLGALGTLTQAFSVNVWMLLIARGFTFFALGGIQSVFLVLLSRVACPERQGTIFGWANSVNIAGGVICAILSSNVVYFFGVRGVFCTAAILCLLLLPLLIPASHAYFKEINRRQSANNLQMKKIEN